MRARRLSDLLNRCTRAHLSLPPAALQLGADRITHNLYFALAMLVLTRMHVVLQVIAGSLHPEQPPLLMAAAEGQVLILCIPPTPPLPLLLLRPLMAAAEGQVLTQVQV